MIGEFLTALGVPVAMAGAMEAWLTVGTVALVWSVTAEANFSR